MKFYTLKYIGQYTVIQVLDVCGLQLIQEAVDHGDTHKDTMQLADYWLLVRVHLTLELLLIQHTYFYEEGTK